LNTYSALQAAAVEFVRERKNTRELLIVAATRDSADEIARLACGCALAGVHRFALRELVYALSSRALNERSLVPIRGVVREALAARIVAGALRDGRLRYLHRVAEFPGFARALSTTLHELRLAAVDIEKLRSSAQSGPDLAWLLEAYTRELAERRLADSAEQVQLASETVQSGKHPLLAAPVLIYDVAPRTMLERRLIEALRDRAPDAPELTLQPTTNAPRFALESLQRNIGAAAPPPVRAPDDSFELFSASGEALECVEIARKIHEVAAAGARFDEIAILLRNPERYQALAGEALRRAGIPVFYTQGARRPDPVGRGFVSLLHCAREGLSASRFSEYMSLGQMPFEQSEPRAPAAWERLLVDAAVIGGRSRWESRLRGLTAELHERHARSDDEADRLRIAERIEELENLSDFVLPIIDRLASLPGQAMWTDWLARLHELADAALRRAREVHELLDDLAPLADVGPVDLESVLRILAPRLTTLRTQTEGARYGRVFVGSIEEARGLSFRFVYVPGLNEGLFPRPAAEDPLLLDRQRKELAIDLRMRDEELLRVAITCASERLTLSFSRLDLLTGRERVPSFYAFDAYRAAGGRDSEISEFQEQARARTTTRIGWPAPANPAVAIDDAEYDLATLAAKAPGSGEYLKRLPGRAVDSLRVRWRRWHKPWRAADGLIVEEIGDPVLEQHRPAKRAYAVSALQQFARCPYRFALHSIFHLRTREKLAGIQRIDPATRGELYHRVQFELLRALQAEDLLPINAEHLTAIVSRLDEILARAAAEYEKELAPAIPQIWRAEMEAIRADLRGWVRYKALLEPDWTPLLFEFSFGLRDTSGHDPRSSSEPAAVTNSGFRTVGSIDLIEQHSTGAIRVVDHKTGKIADPKPQIIGGGEVLQPALYAMAAEELLREPVSCGRLFFSTLKQNYQTIDVPLDEVTKRRAEQSLQTIDRAVRDGFLPAAPRKDGCKGCEYLPICGPYEEERVSFKSQPELKALKELRSWR
jgi:ATP-dependent helicase/nuclease subunit B